MDCDTHSNDNADISPQSSTQVTDPSSKMSDHEVLGVIVLARNGDRLEYYQDPKTYAGSFTETTPLGEAQSHLLGCHLRSIYLDEASPSHIKGMRTDLVDNNEIHVRVKAGGEGTVVFDSAIAVLQGLFPPNAKNSIKLANETTVVAPLGGYQYVPVETVEPGNDRSLESWTSCPAFEKHVAAWHNSDEFKAKKRDAEPFFNGIRDFVFGRPLNLENIWNIYDFVSSELIHNKTYAYRLPPTYIEQAQGLVDFHENGVFSDKSMGGIGNIAGRTVLHTILSSLERIAFNGDPLQFLLIESTYQPFISLFHETGIVESHPELKGVPNYASALAIELRRSSPPDSRDFLRFRYRNGTEGDFKTLQVFGKHHDIPLTEFIYRSENSAISSNNQWYQTCNSGSATAGMLGGGAGFAPSSFVGAIGFIFLLGLFAVSSFVRQSRAQSRLRLVGDENLNIATSEKGRLV